MPERSSLNNRIRIPPYLWKKLQEIGITNTEAATVLVTSLLFLYLNGDFDISVNELMKSKRERVNELYNSGKREGGMSEAEAALMDLL